MVKRKIKNKFVVEWRGKFYDCEWFDNTDFEKLNPIKGVHGFVFNDKDAVCIVKTKGKEFWSDTGGGCEKFDKTFEDTFIREVDEEADLEIKNLQRLGYIKSITRENPEDVHFQLRFVARVKKIKPQTIDPAEGAINERKFVSTKDFSKYTGWGDNGDFQIKKALKKLKAIK